MAAAPPSFLRDVELRLLRCTVPSASSSSPDESGSSGAAVSFRRRVSDLLAAIERGDYAATLSSDAARLPFDAVSIDGLPGEAYAEAGRCSAEFLRGSCEGEEEERCALLLSLAVAAILAFAQQNITGPPGKFPSSPLCNLFYGEEKSEPVQKWNAWALSHLSSVGSHVRGKFSLLQYIVYADMLLKNLMDMHDSSNYSSQCCTASWWLFRLLMLHQRISDELSSSLFDQVQVQSKVVMEHFGKSERVCSYWDSLLRDDESSDIAAAACLEAGLSNYKYGYVDSSRSLLDMAEEASQLHTAIKGVLGFRTIHQVDPKPLLVLQAHNSRQVMAEEHSEVSRDSCELPAIQNGSFPVLENDSCEVYRVPKLLQNGDKGEPNGYSGDPANNIPLTAIQQAVVMAKCLLLSKTGRSDEYSVWQLAPYIESVDSQSQSFYLIRGLCNVLRARWESIRGRTRERALLLMENLIQSAGEEQPAVNQRILLVFGVYIPYIPALKKEYAEILVSCGLIGEALRIFEDLELWDNLIYCYRLLEKTSESVSLIKARLSVSPDDPRLWCSLGDVTNNDAHYEKALEVSNRKSARALRSLARSAYNRNDFHVSKTLWKEALSLNSLYPDGWFSYGAAAWKDNDYDTAVKAFTSAVQIDPDNGEAWNNIACMHMMRGDGQRAFTAFKQAIKFKRNNWEVWDNFSKVAYDTGNLQQTLEAVKMVVNLSNNKRVNVLLLDLVLCLLEKQSSVPPLPFRESTVEEHVESYSVQDLKRCGYLLDMLGDILQQVVRSTANEDIWGLLARWYKIKGNLELCSEALLKQVRALQSSETWHDEKKFKKFARASLQLCFVYVELSSSAGTRQDLIRAEMHLKSTIKKSGDFHGITEFMMLNDCLSDIQKRLAVTP